jgi:uncharacterized membrane protein
MAVDMLAAKIPVSAPPYQRRRRWKQILWTALAVMTLSVIFYSEVPLLRQAQERAYLGTILLLIVPHVMAGSIALLAGPLQFSSRVHRGSPRFHRVLGRVYVVAVFVAAPLSIVLAYHRHDPHAMHWLAAVTVQSGTWMLTTGAAFVTAWNGHYQRHREWMVRCYAVTFTFFPRPLKSCALEERRMNTGLCAEEWLGKDSYGKWRDVARQASRYKN